MKKKYLILIPTIIILLIINNNYNLYMPNKIEEIIIFITTYFLLLLINVIAPILYVCNLSLDFKSSKKIVKKIIVIECLIIANAIIASPNSILYYINAKGMGSHDIDMFPMFLIVPNVIFFISTIFVLLKNWRKNR